MKSSKKYDWSSNKHKWDNIFGKMGLLLDAIMDAKGGEMNIDDTEYKWVEDRMTYWNKDNRILTKDEMRVCNNLWNVYGRY